MVLSCCAGLNWNVRLSLIVAPLAMASANLMEMPIGPFVLLLMGSNLYVGIANGLSGLTLLFVGPVAGCVSPHGLDAGLSGRARG